MPGHREGGGPHLTGSSIGTDLRVDHIMSPCWDHAHGNLSLKSSSVRLSQSTAQAS